MLLCLFRKFSNFGLFLPSCRLTFRLAMAIFGIMINSVAVFLGSSFGSDEHMKFAYEFGHQLAEKGFKVIFGGAEVGTMKAFAEGVLDAGGDITGVFPKGFGGKREIAATHRNILMSKVTRTIEVKDMAERMSLMNAMSDCCVVLPGGYGSMEELFCYAVDNEIGVHDKQAYVLNAGGFYDALEELVATMKREHFLKEDSSVIKFVHSADEFFADLD